MEKMLDAKGLTCPKPVILTKKEMDQSKAGDVILVEVDNEMAVANLRKLANSQEAEYASKKLGDKQYQVRITVTKKGSRESEMLQEMENCTIGGVKKNSCSNFFRQNGGGRSRIRKYLDERVCICVNPARNTSYYDSFV